MQKSVSIRSVTPIENSRSLPSTSRPLSSTQQSTRSFAPSRPVSSKTPLSRVASTRSAKSIASISEQPERRKVQVSKEEIAYAIAFCDKEDGKKAINQKNLVRAMKEFGIEYHRKELALLFEDNSEFDQTALENLLLNNEIYAEDFDPVAEVFQLYDPEEQGFIDPNHLKQIMGLFVPGEITDEDMETLLECAGATEDGKITLEHFRNMIDLNTAVAAEANKQETKEKETTTVQPPSSSSSRRLSIYQVMIPDSMSQ